MSMPIQKPGKSKQDYGTPPELFWAVKNRLQIHDFVIDLAASPDNAVTSAFYTEEMDALLQPWFVGDGWNWCNPPYANIGPWVAKARWEAKKGAQTIMLVPASVGSNWWKEWVDPYAYVAHLNGRLTFVGETKPYPKDCSLLFYTTWGFRGTEVWDWRRDVPQLLESESSEDKGLPEMSKVSL